MENPLVGLKNKPIYLGKTSADSVDQLSRSGQLISRSGEHTSGSGEQNNISVEHS
jgi:predicted secreted Zn-dependent protease